jgi:hypothetical protein
MSDADRTRAEARTLADEAANSYARGDYVRAEVLLQRAQAMVPAPTVALLRARALVRLRRWVQACSVYESAFRSPLGADSPPAFRRAVLDARLEHADLLPRIPKLRVAVVHTLLGDDSLVVRLDGRPMPRGELDAWRPVDPKGHVLDLELKGKLVQRQHVVLGEKEARGVLLDVPAQPRTSTAQTWGLVGIGAGGAAIGVGVATGVLALNAHAEVERQCPNGRCAAGSSGAEELERFHTYRTVSTIGYAVGVVGVGAGAVLLLTAPGETTTRFALLPSLRGVRVEGSW